MSVKVKGESESEWEMIFQILTGMEPRNPFPGSVVAFFQKQNAKNQENQRKISKNHEKV